MLDATSERPNVVEIADLTDLCEPMRVLSSAQIQQIAAQLEEVVYLRELDGVISYISPGYERIWGRPVSQVVGRETAWLDSIDLDDRVRVSRAWVRMRAGHRVSEVYRISQPDGASRWVHDRGFPIQGPEGGILRYVGVIRDITNARRLEQELRHAKKMEAMGTLASGVAHSLRNTLQAIVSSVEVAQRSTAIGPIDVAMLDRAATVAKHGAMLIEHLLTFARKQEAKIRPQPLRFDEWLLETAGLIKSVVGEQIRVELGTEALSGIVMADPAQLEEVLLNLVANSRDAMPTGGTLTIWTRETVLDEQEAMSRGISAGLHLILTVQDTGTGMDVATKSRAFEPFFTTKEVGKGTGLGLSTVFDIIRQFGGCIDLESDIGRGTSFAICLPSTRVPASAEIPGRDGPTRR